MNFVIRSKLSEDETINEFFEKMKEQILSDISNQPYPFDMLIKKLNIKVDNKGYPWGYECLKYGDSVFREHFQDTKEFENYKAK